MHFSEKLDILMNLSKTSNSELARHLSLDASHISRLRRGERQLVPDAPYMKPMATYLAKQLQEPYQQEALLEALGVSEGKMGNLVQRAGQILAWFVEPSGDDASQVRELLRGISDFRFGAAPKLDKRLMPGLEERMPGKEETRFDFGLRGKRELVLEFLGMALREDVPRTLLLYSDEPMEWLMGDVAFLKKWGGLLARVIQKGHRIRIVHTVSRNLDEMMSAINGWLPLYMTGAIEPWYYPKKRDGVFRRTLFVMEGTAALSATSIAHADGPEANLLTTEERAVRAFAEELRGYFKVCRPLMRIYTARDDEAFLSDLKDFENVRARAMVLSPNLTLNTMPLEVLQGVLSRASGIPDEEAARFERRSRAFEQSLERFARTDILQLRTPEEVQEGVRLGFGGIQSLQDEIYTPQEYLDHLENIARLLDTYPRYNVQLDWRRRPLAYRLYAKEDLGVLVVKTEEPRIVLLIDEGNLSAAFWDYLEDRAAGLGQTRSDVRARIARRCEEIREAMG